MELYLISVMLGQFCRPEAKLSAPAADRLAPQNLAKQNKNKNLLSLCCETIKGNFHILHSLK